MLHIILLSLAVAMPPLQQRTDTTFNVDARGRIDVENNNGDIHVRTWDRSAVRVRADHSQNVEVDIDAVGSVVRVEAEHRRGRGTTNEPVTYEIWIPAGFNAVIEGVDSNIVLENLGGEVEAESVNGNIVLRGGTGTIHLESVSGEILVDGARGDITAETVNLGVRITRSSGDITAETVNGSIHLSGIESSRVEATSVNGDVRYEGTIRQGGRYDMDSHNGDISVTIPEGTDADVTISTHNGNIATDFDVRVRQMDSRRRLSFTLGDGGARINLESFGGSIELRRPGNR
jgi:Putative adhesin